MARFDDLLDLVMKAEGAGQSHNPTGYADITGDPGGVTNWGISQRAWLGMKFKLPYAGFPDTVKNFRREHAVTVYQNEYYLPVHGDSLPKGVAYVVFDAAVNQGPRTAVQILQRALGVLDDGIWGSKTEGAVRLAARDVPKLVEDCCWQRLLEYAKDAKNMGKATEFPWFLVTLWTPRLVAVRNMALRLGA